MVSPTMEYIAMPSYLKLLLSISEHIIKGQAISTHKQ